MRGVDEGSFILGDTGAGDELSVVGDTGAGDADISVAMFAGNRAI